MKCLVCENENIKSEHVYCGICGTKIKKDEPSANEFDHKKINLFKLYHEAGGTGNMEKIELLLLEFIQECAEKKINVVIGIDGGKEIRGAVVGNPITACKIILHLENQLKSVGLPVDDIKKNIDSLKDTLNLDNCPCPNCTARRAAEQEHVGTVVDNEEIFSMLAKMLKGENNG